MAFHATKNMGLRLKKRLKSTLFNIYVHSCTYIQIYTLVYYLKNQMISFYILHVNLIIKKILNSYLNLVCKANIVIYS